MYAALGLELLIGIALAVVWLREPAPPDPDLSHLHPATQSELQELRRDVIDDGSSEHWQTLGEVYLLFGRFAEARFCCEQAARLAPTSYRAFYWWGLSQNQLGETDGAIEHFRRAAELAMDQSRPAIDVSLCWYAIGRNQLKAENVAEAEAAFRQAGDFLPARHQLIRIFIRSNRSKEAVALLQPLIAAHPDEQAFYQLRAAAREQLGERQKAAEDRLRVERCFEHLPSDVLISQLQHEVKRFGMPRRIEECKELLNSGQASVAASRLRELLLEEWRPQIAKELATVEQLTGNPQQAIDLNQEIVTRWRMSPFLFEQLSSGYYMLGQERLAVEFAERGAAMQPLESLHGNLSAFYQRGKDAERAKHHQALSLYARGRGAFRKNRLTDAQRDFEFAVELLPRLAHAWYYLGECRRVRGDDIGAVEAFRSCLEANPNHGRALKQLEQHSS